MANNKGSSLRTQVLEKILHKTEFPWNNNPVFYVSLHTSSPGTGGNQTTNEATYTGYARVAIDRDFSAWNITGNVATNIDDITFPECQSGTQTITHVAIGTDEVGAGTLLWQGNLTSSSTVNTGNTPRIVAGALTLTEL